jgi:hypothetical protein
MARRAQFTEQRTSMGAFDGRPVLIGVKRPSRPRRDFLNWLRLDRRRASDATYAVVAETPQERRREPRRRVHLRSGKILSEAERFLVDCGVHNLSRFGVQLRLAARVPLPREFLFFDESNDAVMQAEIIWRRGDIVGCRIVSGSVKRGVEIARKLRKPFYTVR